MYFFYNIVSNLIIIISPVIIFFRVIKGKEDIKRVQEKFCIYSQKKNKKKNLVTCSKCWRANEYSSNY